MYTKKLLLFFIFSIFIIHCNIFEPENDKGSISIKLTSENDSTKLLKAQETLYTVHCTVKKGSSTIHNEDHSKNNNGSFSIKINDLDPADNYSVLLYGKNNNSKIIGRAYKSGISVKAGKEESVDMSWSDMRPVLNSPKNGNTITDDTPTFDWSAVNDAAYYELEVDNTSSFSSPEINENNLTSSDYTVSSSLSEDTYYWRVRAKDSQGSWCEWSETWSFTISPKTITVTSPNGGEHWELGSNHTITWSSSNAGSNVKIELYKGSSFYKTIISSTNNDGSYNWLIPLYYDDYDSYKIKITCTSDAEIYDFSDDYFSLTETYIEITSPNGGESWELGSDYIIEWTSSNAGSHVKIELYKQSNFYKLIKNSDANDDSCYWSIPSDYDEYNYYKIKITSASSTDIYDFSDDYFSLVYSDPYEPNDSRPEAEPITFSGTPPTWQSGSGPEINPSTDQDWFSFSASSGDSIIAFCNVTSQLDPEIVLYFGGTRVLNMDATFSGENETLSYIVPSGNDGTYYIGIGYYSNISKSSGVLANTGSYTLEIRKVPDTTGPEAPVLISPDNGSTSKDNTPTFDWSDVNEAVYELEVDNSSNFSSPEIDQPGLISSNYTPSSSLPNDTYYWRVRSKDNRDNWGGWSNIWHFTITDTVATPTFDPSPGTYTTPQDVTISCSTAEATIHYTTNGSDPTESDPVYSNPVHIATTTELRAKAYKSGWTESDVAKGIYTITGTVATPIFDPSPGTYTTPQDVTISCSTAEATIHYTTNGSDPTESDPVYSNPMHIATTTELRAKAYKSGWTESDVASATYTIIPPSTQLIAYYPFNGNAIDESGNGNDGTVHGATLTSDRFGNTNSAYTFDGNDWIDIPDDISPENISLCGWVYPDKFDNINSSPIITKETGTGTGPTFGWRLNILKNTHQIQYQISTTDRWIGIYSTTELQQNQWYHVIGTFDGSNMKLFINGILEADTTIIPSGKLNQTTMPAAIGHLQGSSVQWFYGKIDDIRIYNYALSISEIEDLYQEGGWPDELTVTDIDGNTYKTVKIGNQWWMAENLKVTHYRNGDPIPNVTSDSEWGILKTGAYCAYNNNESTTDTYGYLYNWFSINDSRKIAPEGWHVPTDAEWKELEMYLGMNQSEADNTGWRGTDEGGKLKETGTTHWNSPNTGATNESGFTALPGGYRYSLGSNQMNYGAYFWSVTEYNNNNAWRRLVIYSSSNIYRNYANKTEGFSVRCIKDN